jgi:hypothetical protein
LDKSKQLWKVLKQYVIADYQEVKRDWKVGGLF